jgi:glycosyltransferase involved in cell wall biosynthesis
MINPQISIIIPVYNAEKMLPKAVDSVLSQTEKNLELILVDDGSIDKTLDLCYTYAKKDSRVKVIHQANAGVSSARNVGLAVATGEYIGFVDADDWIELDMYEQLLKEAITTDADIVMCDAKTVYSNGKQEQDTITQLSSDTILTKEDFNPNLLLEMAGAVWRCIYKKDLIKNNLVEFPIGVKFSEDRIFNLYAMGYSNRVKYVKKAYYNRFINKESAVHSFHSDYFEMYKLAANEITKSIKLAWNNDENYQKAYLSQFISGSIMAICNYYYKTSTFTSKEKREAVIRLCNDKQLRNAIRNFENIGIKEKWIANKNIKMLILYAKIANLKHGR